jgi:adenylyltransferase/sulfurtransferase
MDVEEVSVQELRRQQDSGTQLCLLDVREPWEVAIAQIPGALHIPMGEVPQRLAELDRDARTVVMCKSGGRSLRVAAFLKSRGFAQVANLSGGIDAWKAEIDPSLQSY